jgi:hypothetical protein
MPIVAVLITEGLRTEPDRLADLSFASYTYRSDCRSNGWNVGVSEIAGSSGLNEFRTAINANIRASIFLFHFRLFCYLRQRSTGIVVRCDATDGFRGIWGDNRRVILLREGRDKRK